MVIIISCIHISREYPGDIQLRLHIHHLLLLPAPPPIVVLLPRCPLLPQPKTKTKPNQEQHLLRQRQRQRQQHLQGAKKTPTKKTKNKTKENTRQPEPGSRPKSVRACPRIFRLTTHILPEHFGQKSIILPSFQVGLVSRPLLSCRSISNPAYPWIAACILLPTRAIRRRRSSTVSVYFNEIDPG